MPRKIYVFIGVQGSGKGTQAELLAKKFELCHISTGDLLRSSTGELKTKIDSYINQGNFVPNELILEILKERMVQHDCDNGIIFDGFPRNLEQAKALDTFLEVTKVIEIKISDSESLKRLLGRRVCEKCGRSYNIYTSPKPEVEGFCDICGGKLVKRADDNEDAIKKRIATYHNETEPLLDYYKDKLVSINGENTIELIFEELIKRLS